MRSIGAIVALLLGATFAPADPPRPAPAETKFVAAPFCAALVFEPTRLDKFRCANADAATAVHTTLKDLLAMAKDAYPDARKDLEKMFAPETAKALLPFIDEVATGHTLTKTGSTVVLTAAPPKSPTPKP